MGFYKSATSHPGFRGAGSNVRTVGALRLGYLFFFWILALAQSLAADTNTNVARTLLLSRQGKVDYSRARQTNWVSAILKQQLHRYDRLRTMEASRATLRLEDYSVLRLNELSQLELLPPRRTSAKARLDFKLGALYFLHRNRPREIEVNTPTAIAAIEGTEFHIRVDANGATVLTMIDGAVDLSNPQGSISLQNGEQGIVEPGLAPRKTAVIDTANIVQWCLYYPAVLDPADLGLTPGDVPELESSLTAYRSGDILQALRTYPPNRPPATSSERAYRAGLSLAVGQLEDFDQLRQNTAGTDPLTRALDWLVAAVKLRDPAPFTDPANASQWLAKSYYLQSRHELSEARYAAQEAVRLSPEFGFAWAHLAELEFSFGRWREARAALTTALKLAPRHAQAHALMGFLLLRQGRVPQALRSFETALAIDDALGNAWLGRGLCRIRRGNSEGGRADLQTAAAMEPNRSILRSYLGKAYRNAADHQKTRSERRRLATLAEHELELAKQLDPMDPTPWLYSAMMKQQQIRVREAIDELEHSITLNDNRQVYRSRMLLDQDMAVRNANLANIYNDADMETVSIQESSRAVSFDYANFTAHQNLANSFNSLRDPTRFNLRHESAWFHETLLANMLAPGGGALLSLNFLQHEVFRPFATKRFGLSLAAEYFSDGDFFQLGSHFGSFGHTSYALDVEYQHRDGRRPNNDLQRIEWYSQIKHQLTDQDAIFVMTKYQDFESGDNFQYYDPANASRHFRFEEFQEPLLLAGYHREWGPGNHTLFLGGRLVNDQSFEDQRVNSLALEFVPGTRQVVGASIIGLNPFDGSDIGGMDVDYNSQFETYTAELSQIFQRERHLDVFGARFQMGRFETRNRLTLNFDPPFQTISNNFAMPPASGEFVEDLERISIYEYHTWEVIDNLLLTAGVAYDHLRYPDNFRHVPVSSGETTSDQISPKAAVIWNPDPRLTLRAAYSQSLGGVSFDESARLEPTQLAGFGQSFRSVISESVVGSVAAPSYESYGVGLDLRFPSHTYVTLEGVVLGTDVDRTVGVFSFTNAIAPFSIPDTTPERLDYREESVGLTVNQIVGQEWFFEAQYRFTRSDLDRQLRSVPSSAFSVADTSERADLHRVGFAGLYRHSSGLFARAEWWWFHQENDGFNRELGTTQLPDDEFHQVNFWVGYELPRKRGSLSVGILNITDQDYRLNPLNVREDIPRERLYTARLRLNF